MDIQGIMGYLALLRLFPQIYGNIPIFGNKRLFTEFRTISTIPGIIVEIQVIFTSSVFMSVSFGSLRFLQKL